MNRNVLIAFTIALFAIAMTGCKAKKKANVVSVDVEMVNKYWQSQFDSEYVEARGKASVTTNGNTKNVSMHLKMKKDSLIWGKFSLFGIGATVLINKDSFFMINTLSQTYMAYDNSYLNSYLGFKANLSQLQNLLLGNALFEQSDYTFESSEMKLVGNEGLATNTLELNDKTRTLRSMISTEDTTQNAEVQYDEYLDVNNMLMPKIVSIDVTKGTQNLDVVLNYQNINTKIITTFPFKIPNGFTRN